MSRPELTLSLPAEEFSAWYWQKDELVAFCRAAGLPASGAKQALAARIHRQLAGLPPLENTPRPPAKIAMPGVFTPETKIGPGWRCTQALRAFFEKFCGPTFHFNAELRALIAEGAGQTLAEAIAIYQASLQREQPREIDSQFEYNRHMRAYFQQHPQATRAEALAAWRLLRNSRKT